MAKIIAIPSESRSTGRQYVPIVGAPGFFAEVVDPIVRGATLVDGVYVKTLMGEAWPGLTFIDPEMIDPSSGGPLPPVDPTPKIFSLTSEPIVIIDKPSNMGGFGPYYPTLLDLRADTFPADWAAFYTTDHDDGVGGIWASFCRGAPDVKANWKTYDEALAAGWFASISDKPASTPLFSGQQSETPVIRKFGSTWVMTFQRKLNANEQYTFRAKSTNLLRWTIDTTPLLRVTDVEKLHTAYPHTGYFVWDKNPFSAIPFEWFGYSLLTSGQGSSLNAMWGSNDPENGAWTFLGALYGPRGRIPAAGGVVGGYGLIQADIRSAVKLPNGNVAMLTTSTANPVAGSQISPQGTAEFEIGPDGKTPISRGAYVAQPEPSTALDTVIGNPNFIPISGSEADGYEGFCLFRVADTQHVNKLAIAKMSRKPARALAAPALTPAVPASRTEIVWDFSGNARPAGLSQIDYGAGVAFAGGDAVFTTDTINQGAQFYETAGFDPRAHDVIDLLMEDFLTTSADCYRRVLFGFATTPAADTANMANALYAYNTANNTMFWNTRKAGVAGTQASLPAAPWLGYQGAFGQKMRKTIGLRWWPVLQRAVLLGFGKEEVGEMLTIPGLTTLSRYYPFVEVKALANGATTEAVSAMRVVR